MKRERVVFMAGETARVVHATGECYVRVLGVMDDYTSVNYYGSRVVFRWRRQRACWVGTEDASHMVLEKTTARRSGGLQGP